MKDSVCLGQVALAAGPTKQAEKYLRECIDLLDDYGESPDLGIALLYLGKCLAVRQDIHAARSAFQKLSQIGQTFNLFDLINIGLVNCARLYVMEQQAETALEILLTLRQYPPMEVKVWQNESDSLLNELKDSFPREQFEEVSGRIMGWTIESLNVFV